VRELFVLGEADGATPFASLLQHQGAVPAVHIDLRADLAILPYSSGTTGLPKGVMLTHRGVVANLTQQDAAMVGDVRLQADDVVLDVLPFFHAFGMIIVMNYALRTGATVVTLPRFALEPCLQIMQDYWVSYTYLVPPLVLTLATHPRVDAYDLSPLRFIVCGAAPLGAEVAHACTARLGSHLAQGYGMTEASPGISIDPVLPGMDKPGSVGPIVPNTEAQVVDLTTGAALGPNQQGEIWVRGPQVMPGYLNNPAATATTIDADGWLHTGDVGYADTEGYFYLVDRVKELIKYKGFQVAPAELEAMLLTHPAVADVAVIGRPDDEAGEVPKAFVAFKGSATAQELMGFVAERVAQIPKSPTGKILRRVLVEQEQACLHS
jgi:acyl-CoA synthetase (AMP-forming)/AMP-acid ligase II